MTTSQLAVRRPDPTGPARTVAAPVLVASGLRLAYDAAPVVVDGDLSLRAGEVTALVGPNGSGKSTLLRALARLHRPDAGTVRLADGSDALALTPKDFARRVTLLSQNRPTPGGVSVGEVVAYGRHPHRASWRGTDPGGQSALASALSVTGLTAMAGRAVDELSGGELQRVWLASCLAQDTSVLLLDEPTNHLDLRYQVEVLDLVRDLADHHGVAVGVVLHDLDQAAAVADSVVLLDRGRVVAAGTPSEVLTGAALSKAYGLTIEVTVDPDTGALRARPVGRHTRRALPPAPPPDCSAP